MKLTEKRIYKFAKQKAYFDAGYGTTSYLKVIFAVVGVGGVLSGLNLLWVVALGAVYGIGCYILGYLMYKYNYIEAEKEVLNQYDLFVKEIRASGAVLQKR